MNREYFQIKDQCRKGLIKYLEKMVSVIPKAENLHILDAGCGTGVPAFVLAEYFSGSVTAIDIYQPALTFFQEKVEAGNLQNKINIQKVSFFDYLAEHNTFDIILAEGFLNVVGFEKGFKRLIELLKPGGYLIIHDEFKYHEKKTGFIKMNNCTLIETLYLDETIWWNDYYYLLEKKLKETMDKDLTSLFRSDLLEIELYKTDPTQFRSIYYLVLKNEDK